MEPMNLFAGQDTQTRRTDFWTQWRKEESSQWEADVEHREPSLVLCDGLEGFGGREAREGGDVCTRITDSRCCSAETSIRAL